MERLASGLYVPPLLKMGWWPCGGCDAADPCDACTGTPPDEFDVIIADLATNTGRCSQSFCDSLEATYRLSKTSSCVYQYDFDDVSCENDFGTVTIEHIRLDISTQNLIEVAIQEGGVSSDVIAWRNTLYSGACTAISGVVCDQFLAGSACGFPVTSTATVTAV